VIAFSHSLLSTTSRITPQSKHSDRRRLCMPICRLSLRLPPTNVALRSTRAFVNATMLIRAIHTQASAAKHPLQPKPAATNAPKPVPNKRKFNRTMSTTSSLGALHEHVTFNENEFDDTIDLTISPAPARRQQVQYPHLDSVHYPDLPPASQKAPASSAPVPWSSSPPAHFEPPKRAPSPRREQPAKRRKLPWAEREEEKATSFTPLPRDEKYPWNKSASATKDEQKEFRKKNRLITKTTTRMEPKPVTAISTEMLSTEQKDVVTAVVDQGKSVFFTGSAGTGKSILMRTIIGKFKDKFRREPDRLAVTASTGLAACVIEGQTLHSWAGIGLGREPVPELVKKIKRNAKTRQKWMRTKALIVDEISMVDGELFDKLEQIARNIRTNGRPFGGIQLVITGDFFQLPPVPDKNTVAKFAFDAATWNTCIQHTILLTHVFRQKDPAFANMLNEIRLGKLTPATISSFQRLSRPLDFKDEVEATEL
jgi:ATP-dependent DNA helicase PIF1